MNYLGHCFLSCNDDNLLLGNVVADMIRNKDLDALDPSVVRGVMLHRSIDSYTDAHPSIKKASKLLHKRHGKYAPVITDIFFDYILFHNWDTYSDMSFETFKALVYHQLSSNDITMLPEKVQGSIGRMVDGDWLQGYTTIEGMNYVFSRVAKRAKFDSNILSATDDLIAMEDELTELFHQFMPDVQKHVAVFCEC